MVNTWSTQTRYLALIIMLLLMAALIYYARALISPLVVAALLAYVLDPAVSFLMRLLRIRKKFAVIMVYVGFLLLLASIPATLTPFIVSQFDTIQREFGDFQRNIEGFMERAELFGSPLLPGDPGATTLAEMVSTLFNPERLFGVILAATANLAWILIIAVTTFYFLLDGERIRIWFYGIIPRTYQHDVHRLHLKLRLIWQSYLRGQLLLMLIIGILTWAMGAAVGLPGAIIIGLLAGVLDVIPSVGPLVAMIAAALVAFFLGSTILPLSPFWFALLVVGLFMAIQAFENVWLRPRIFSHRLRLHPAVVIVAIVGALALAGVVAALVIIPLISSLEVVGRYFYRRILGEDPWHDEPPVVPETTELQPVPARTTTEESKGVKTP
jgi:predicted PurR-regulated permease PerM